MSVLETIDSDQFAAAQAVEKGIGARRRLEQRFAAAQAVEKALAAELGYEGRFAAAQAVEKFWTHGLR